MALPFATAGDLICRRWLLAEHLGFGRQLQFTRQELDGLRSFRRPAAVFTKTWVSFAPTQVIEACGDPSGSSVITHA